ncbi:MAG: cupin domain-containing protein [Ignavibacteria bacterium]|nr:cupin domain-containing protein [Ignavibacteria bacterium]
MESFIKRSGSEDWEELAEDGVVYDGVYIKSLRFDGRTNRSPTILIRFDPGASYPFHDHPAGEEIYVLQGEVIIEQAVLREGDYLYTPPGFRHGVRSEKGCVLLACIPEEVKKVQREQGS